MESSGSLATESLATESLATGSPATESWALNSLLAALLAALDRLTGCREALVIADEQARREEGGEGTDDCTDECADARATRALLRVAADVVWMLETAAARTEEPCAPAPPLPHTATTHDEIQAAQAAQAAQAERALERAGHVCAALERASALRCTNSIALVRMCAYTSLVRASAAHDVDALNLGLVLLESLDDALITCNTMMLNLLLCVIKTESDARDTPSAAATIQRLLACEYVALTAGRARVDLCTALMYASRNGHTLCVKALLACPFVRATAAHRNQSGRTALGIASEKAHADTVAALLACPEVRQAAGAFESAHDRTPLMFAASARTRRVLLDCLEVQRTAGKANMFGKTALMFACQDQDPELSVLELLACSEVRRTAGAVCTNGQTALMRFCSRVNAYEKNAEAAIHALLACPEVRRTAGDTDPVFKMTALMRACRACTGGGAYVAALLACPEVRRTAGVRAICGRTALMIAAISMDADMAAALLSCSEVLKTAEAVNKDGDTARSIATRNGNASFLAALQRSVCSA